MNQSAAYDFSVIREVQSVLFELSPNLPSHFKRSFPTPISIEVRQRSLELFSQIEPDSLRFMKYPG